MSIIAATISCPVLWRTPPAMLTPKMENFPVFFKSPIPLKLNTQPPMEYKIPNAPVNKNPTKITLNTFIPSAILKSIEYIATTITKFAIPILNPGKVTHEKGKTASMYENIIAKAIKTAVYPILVVLLPSCIFTFMLFLLLPIGI